MYKIFFLLHFLGAILMFTAVGINLASLIWMVFSKELKIMRICSIWTVKIGKVIPYSIFLLLISSLYLVFAKWDWEVPWINASLIMLVIVAITSIMIDLPRLKEINRTVNAETAKTPSSELIAKVRDRVLWISISITTMEVAAIIHIMIEKLGTIGSILTLVIALIFGFILSKAILYLADKFNHGVIKNNSVSSGR